MKRRSRKRAGYHPIRFQFYLARLQKKTQKAGNLILTSVYGLIPISSYGLISKRVATSIAPRATGGILLIPLRPISDAVGGRIAVDGQTVTVTRLQDGVVMSWNAQTGLISANRKPIGIVQPSALTEIANLLLPKDAVAALDGNKYYISAGQQSY